MTVQFPNDRLDSKPSGVPFLRAGDPSTLWMRCEPGGGFSWSLTADKLGAVNLHTGAVTELPADEVVEFREASVVRVA
jgi:hypothetical protein